jgi:hypothetical protein
MGVNAGFSAGPHIISDGGTVSAMRSNQCGGGRAPCIMRSLATSAMVSVWAQKYGGELTHPIGKMSGKATKCSPACLDGKATPSFGMSSACSHSR